MEGNVVKLRKPPGIRMVADDQRYLTRQLAHVVAVQQVCQAVSRFGNQNRNPRAVARTRHLPVHLEFLDYWCKTGCEFIQLEIEALQLPLHTDHEHPEFGILMIVGVQDIAVMLVNEVGNRSHYPFLLWAL